MLLCTPSLSSGQTECLCCPLSSPAWSHYPQLTLLGRCPSVTHAQQVNKEALHMTSDYLWMWPGEQVRQGLVPCSSRHSSWDLSRKPQGKSVPAHSVPVPWAPCSCSCTAMACPGVTLLSTDTKGTPVIFKTLPLCGIFTRITRIYDI